MLKTSLKVNKLNFDDALGITELDDQASENYLGGAFTVGDATRTVRIDGKTTHTQQNYFR